MITKKQYVEYLLSSPINYTCTNLAKHLEKLLNEFFESLTNRKKLTMKKDHTIGERMGITVAVLLGTPVIIWAAIIFVFWLLELLDLPRPGM